ncbi:MAG: helix-turn-helix transcriptional regulator [Ruminococcus sp.]|nr:helix-turn-helix transcriptional regulator [Ruminococcus sp.]
MFTIDRMGCGCRHDSSFVLDRPKGYEGYLMLFVKTRADFVIGGASYRFEPDTFIIYNKYTPQYYKACDAEYVNDWIQFDCSDNLEASTGVRFDVPVYIGQSIDISQYFKLLADCYYRTGNLRTAGYIIKAMLTEIFSVRQDREDMTTAHYRELLDLRRNIYSAPEEDWSVERMAAQLNVSEPYLHLLYKKAFGVTCNQDVINSRIEQAQRYLSYSGMTVEEVAFSCGYKNTVHFSRQFKQVSGVAPSQWRKTGSGA